MTPICYIILKIVELRHSNINMYPFPNNGINSISYLVKYTKRSKPLTFLQIISDTSKCPNYQYVLPLNLNDMQAMNANFDS